MGFIWDVVKGLTKTVVNVHSLGAFDVPIFEDEEGTKSSKAVSSHVERRQTQPSHGIESEIFSALENAHLLTGHEIKKQELGIALGIFLYWRLGYEQLSREERKRSALFLREDCEALQEVLIRRMIADGFAPQAPLDHLDEYIKALINNSESVMGAANRLGQLFAEIYMVTTGEWPMEPIVSRRIPILASLNLTEFCESVQLVISNVTEERFAETTLPIHVIRSSGGLIKYRTVLVTHLMARILNDDESSANVENQEPQTSTSLAQPNPNSINLPTKLEQTTATIIGDKIVFVWIKRDKAAPSPLENATSGYLFSFNQSDPNPLPEQHRDEIVNDPNAVPLSCYQADGKILWTVRDSTVPVNSIFERNRRKLGGVWVPNDTVRSNIAYVSWKSEYGNQSPSSLMLQRAQDVCEQYSAWRNGDYYWYYIATYKVRRDGHRVLDRYDDYKAETELYTYTQSCGGIYRWQVALDDVKRAFERVMNQLQTPED